MDFVSDLLSVTMEKLKNIDLAQDQTTHIRPNVLNSHGRRMTNSEEYTNLDSEQNAADESTMSKTLDSEAQGCTCNNICNLSIQSFVEPRIY
jgi:hypothetical protein